MSTEPLYCWIIAEHQIGPPDWKERRVSPVFYDRAHADAWILLWRTVVPCSDWKLKEISMPDGAAALLSSKLPERYERAIWDYEYHQDWLEQLADEHSGVAGRED